MKTCPKCRRTYTDETLNFCLEDGASLVLGVPDEPATAILSEPGASAGGQFVGENPTRQFTHASAAEGEPQVILGDVSEKHSFSTNRAAKPLAALAASVVLLLGGFFAYRYFAPTKQIESIAVMPFENQSGNPEVDYLSEGMTETLINTLTQLPNLNVKPRSSVIRFKESDTKTVGKELNVHVVLNGRLLQRGDEITLFLSLVDTADEKNIWGKQYTRKLANLVALQTEIARDVTDSLKPKLSRIADQPAAKGETTNPEAYRLYLLGRFFWNKRRIADNGRAIDYFQQSIALDPNYAKAYAGLADAIAQPSDVIPHPEREKLAKEAVLKALSIDNEQAEAHAALAHILTRYDLDFSGAERELQLALDLDRKWADTYQRYGELYSFLDRHDEALSKIQEGLAIEPFNLPLNTNYGSLLLSARRYDEAVAQINKTLEMDRNFRDAHVILASAYAMKGMYPESVRHRIISLELAGGPRLIDLANRIREVFEEGGWDAVMRAELERLETSERTLDRTSYYAEAVIHAALGEKENAFAALNRSIEAQENPALVRLKVDPRFDPLRDDHRFDELLRKIGFPE